MKLKVIMCLFAAGVLIGCTSNNEESDIVGTYTSPDSKATWHFFEDGTGTSDKDSDGDIDTNWSWTMADNVLKITWKSKVTVYNCDFTGDSVTLTGDGKVIKLDKK